MVLTSKAIISVGQREGIITVFFPGVGTVELSLAAAEDLAEKLQHKTAEGREAVKIK